MITLRSLMTALVLMFCCACAGYAQGVWTTDTSTAFVPRYSAASAVIDNRIYLIGGSEDPQIPVQYFDPETHTWNTPVLTGEGMFTTEAAACVLGSNIYVFGGWNQARGIYDTLRVIDPAVQMVYRPVTSGVFSARVGLTASVVGNKIYLIGGETDHIIDTMEVFDPQTNTFTIVHPSGPFDPGVGMSATVMNGKIFLIGGLNPDHSPSDKLRKFDPARNTWSILSTNGAFTARAFHGAEILNSKIYIVGGGSAAFPLYWGGEKDTSAEVEIFDPSTNTWSRPYYPGLFSARTMLSTGALNNKLYALGGYRPHGPTNDVEVYDPQATDGTREESVQTAMTIYPNPATDHVTVSNIPARTASSLRVIDALGRCVERASLPAGVNSSELDLTRCAPGIYTVSIGDSVVRLVKE
ncbi:MAG: T9SS type A sorting domain-containing protein [Bacteroidetes bacterium]|nr:T9SS type A sorting domain-containing protein [Bacteroidota bacterium]